MSNKQTLKTAYEGLVGDRLIAISKHDVAVGQKQEGKTILSMKLHPNAKTLRGIFIVAVKVILLNGEDPQVPGLVKVGDIWVYLPIISPYQLLQLLIMANERMTAIGAAA